MNPEDCCKYKKILVEELIPAEGCTEPIALAYCAAVARKALGKEPQKIVVKASGNIIKNVKSVVVPNTNGRKGIAVAAIYGAIAGHPDRELEVLQSLEPDLVAKAEEYCLNKEYVEISHLETPAKLHIIIEVYAGDDRATAEIRDKHTKIVRIEKNGDTILLDDEKVCEEESSGTEFKMALRGIVEYAQTVDIEEVRPIIEKQINCNTKICEEGIAGNYGANVGKTLLELYGSDLKMCCVAKAAAGSSARMSGAELPVVINSGSGNQGITVSVPVVVYARGIGASDEKLIRALVISNLVAVYQKQGIGRLSAYCGAVSAATASVTAIAWMDGASIDVMENTIRNTLGDIAGIVCDGAKASCAAKIATSLQAAFMGYEMAKRGRTFAAGDGIVKNGADNTITAIGLMASKGMVQTDREIIDIMIAD